MTGANRVAVHHFRHELVAQRVAFRLLLRVDCRAQTVDDALCLVEVDGHERLAYVVLHVFDETTYVGHVRRVVRRIVRGVGFFLSHQTAAQIRRSDRFLGIFQREHHGRRHFVVRFGKRPWFLFYIKCK